MVGYVRVMYFFSIKYAKNAKSKLFLQRDAAHATKIDECKANQNINKNNNNCNLKRSTKRKRKSKKAVFTEKITFYRRINGMKNPHRFDEFAFDFIFIASHTRDLTFSSVEKSGKIRNGTLKETGGTDRPSDRLSSIKFL